MWLKKVLSMLAICSCLPAALAITPQDPKYCTMLQELQPNMQIGDVFLLMGPPHTFGQPPNLNMQALSAQQPVMQPQNAPATATGNTADARARVLKSIAQDPILGAFMSAPPDYQNVLIWDFENNTLNVAVKVKGTTVTDVKANFSCK